MPLVRLQFSIDLQYNVLKPGADFIFNVHAAQNDYQKIESESFKINQRVKTDLFTDPATGNRYVRLRAKPGALDVSYQCTVDIAHHTKSPDVIKEAAIADLPSSALSYIYPSRYCQSDRLLHFAHRTFGNLPKGYSRVAAVLKWVQTHVTFLSNTTNSSTSAVDTLIERVGVCRDFAHLMIALCRALSIPARIATGTDYGADPTLGPPDLHAYVEVYLGDRWYIFDPSGTTIPMGLMRIGTGRDAADVSFATILGPVNSISMKVSTKAVEVPSIKSMMPTKTNKALSTSEQ